MKEELTELGTVIKTGSGFAVIGLTENDACEECSAKIFCSPADNNSKTITAIDPYGVRTGDKVTIAVSGQSVLNASLLLYGIPLVILIVLIALGLEIFVNSSQPELYSFLLGIASTGIYYFVFFHLGKRHFIKVKPAKIISLTRPSL